MFVPKSIIPLLSIPFFVTGCQNRPDKNDETEKPTPIVQKVDADVIEKLNKPPKINSDISREEELKNFQLEERKKLIQESIDEGLITKELAEKILAMPLSESTDLIISNIRNRYFVVNEAFMNGYISPEKAQELMEDKPPKQAYEEVIAINWAIGTGRQAAYDQERKGAYDYAFAENLEGNMRLEEFRRIKKSLALEGFKPLSELPPLEKFKPYTENFRLDTNELDSLLNENNPMLELNKKNT